MTFNQNNPLIVENQETAIVHLPLYICENDKEHISFKAGPPIYAQTCQCSGVYVTEELTCSKCGSQCVEENPHSCAICNEARELSDAFLVIVPVEKALLLKLIG